MEPTALFVHLASRVLLKWQSSTSIELVSLRGGVKSIISQIFNDFEIKYGVELVKAIFGFITFALDGLSDVELEDLLFLHPVVMSKEGISQYNEAKRFHCLKTIVLL